jgi:Glyoxalase-like domain
MDHIRLEHFITSTHSPTIEAHLDLYRQVGFLPEANTVRHNPGLRNGFISFGPEYLELTWVEDQTLFAAGAGGIPSIQTYHAAMRPWGIGLESPDVAAAAEEWRERGYTLPPLINRTAPDADPDAGPTWIFQPLPHDLLPGAHCCALTYHGAERPTPRPVRIAPNTTYALDGITFVTPDPQARALRWGTFLVPHEPEREEPGAATVQIGPHFATWLTPDEYRRRYNRAWQEAPHDRGEIALLHLLADDLRVAADTFARANLPVEHLHPERLLVGPIPGDGCTFLVAEARPEAWAAHRQTQTGEEFTITR